ncbi:LysE family translocator [Muribacter muris]|uniref:LysE family translocator n=1 Tax=Muribacter muris TaxID=67855 RepID=A0A4Y9JXZ4_9PAST|nr:LysE family translocator [Muribacter muris]MBF0785368.1 LysE family translocator [Muribacter muris]MBF0826023.1 LysE family translocator [Muribacter muris]TFV09630.1 LysE family translocator [Muribacter muris]
MALSLLVYFILSSLLIAALPGPAMMLTIQGSIERGWRQGMAITLGILLGDIVLLIAVIAGIGELLSQSPTALSIMGIAVNGYLIYLGIITLWALRSLHLAQENQASQTDWKTGFFITVINPKTIVFLLAYFPQFMDADSDWSTTRQLLLLAGLFLIAVAIVMGGYALSAHFAKRFLNQLYVRKIMTALFGTLLIYLGISGFLN